MEQNKEKYFVHVGKDAKKHISSTENIYREEKERQIEMSIAVFGILFICSFIIGYGVCQYLASLVRKVQRMYRRMKKIVYISTNKEVGVQKEIL